MEKKAYVSDNNVDTFLKWLSLKLSDKSLVHYYMAPGGKRINFAGLEDALQKYDWSFAFKNPSTKSVCSGNTYSQNEVALMALRTGLSASIALGPDSERDVQTRDWSIAVMEWGGVRNGNVTWLTTNVNGLADEIDLVKKTLDIGNDDRSNLRGTIRRFNAGMTKVYSLLVEDFVIYDSRVASALTWLISQWCLETKKPVVPDLLRFPCMHPKEGGQSGYS